MKRLLWFIPIIILVSVCLSIPLYAPPVNSAWYVTGEETILVAGTSVGLTEAKYWTAATSKTVSNYATVTVAVDSIRYFVSGSNPTTALGHLATTGTVITLDSFDKVRKFRAINVTTNATVTVTYEMWY
jgi:hypothetical protein